MPVKVQRRALPSLCRPPNRTGEVHKTKGAIRDQGEMLSVVQKHVLENVLGDTNGMKARRHRSPTNGVCEACFSITALPAIKRGATVLIAVM